MMEDLEDLGPRLPTDEAAKFLGVSQATLARWRDTKEGPGYLKIGGQFFYPSKWLVAYLRKSAVCHYPDECINAQIEGRD